MRATAGRIVHYVPDAPVVLVPDECQPAIVTGYSPSGEETLTVFGPYGITILSQGVQQDEHLKSPGSWHWPERAPE